VAAKAVFSQHRSNFLDAHKKQSNPATNKHSAKLVISIMSGIINCMNCKLINEKAFTLLELIIVIIIIGILATVGLSQYNTTIEKGRSGEGKANLGTMRKLAYEYYLRYGTVATITSSDVGIGSSGVPSSCSSPYYFYYTINDAQPAFVQFMAYRCTTGGKSPQASRQYRIYFNINPSTQSFVTGSQWTDDSSTAPY